MPVRTAAVKRMVKSVMKGLDALNPLRLRKDIQALYALLYEMCHNLDEAAVMAAAQTEGAFGRQWDEHQEGQFLLSDRWFRENVSAVLAEQELQIAPEWFRGKDVLDAGCGNGRWSYGFARLGANVTAVDVNASAIAGTEAALSGFDVRKEFHVCPLERLSEVLPAGRRFDLVFSWGVIHHAQSFTRALDELTHRVKDQGLLYLYLYGRESLSWSQDIDLFKERVRFHSLKDDEQRYRYLLKKAKGDRNQVHNLHDVYAPLINWRLEWTTMKSLLEERGFEDVVRTIEHSELFIRAIKGGAAEYYSRWDPAGKEGAVLV